MNTFWHMHTLLLWGVLFGPVWRKKFSRLVKFRSDGRVFKFFRQVKIALVLNHQDLRYFGQKMVKKVCMIPAEILLLRALLKLKRQSKLKTNIFSQTFLRPCRLEFRYVLHTYWKEGLSFTPWNTPYTTKDSRRSLRGTGEVEMFTLGRGVNG